MIRKASYMDIPCLLVLLSDMSNECSIGYGKPLWSKVVRQVTDAIDCGVVFVLEVDGNIAGSIGGMTSSEWFTDEKSLADLWFYVRPDFRKGSCAIKLLKAFRNAASDIGLPVRVGHVYGGNVDRMDKLYERLGLIKSGSFFVGEL